MINYVCMSLRCHAVDVEIRCTVLQQAIDADGSCVPNHSVLKRNDVTTSIHLFRPENEDRYVKGTEERHTDVVDGDTI